ncbi:MAG: 50S ribosomal protein L24 [Anaerolineae bacterium]|nr:50S ribosomal protein L24 [Anaerolineae bacterium]
MKSKIKLGDVIEVIAGRTDERGKRGEVIKVIPKTHRVVVQGVNIRKKHQRQVQQQNKTIAPGIIELEGPMHISNVMLVCPNCDEATRVGLERDEDNKPLRVCRSCGEPVD